MLSDHDRKLMPATWQGTDMSFNNRDRSGRDPEDEDEMSGDSALEPPYDTDRGCPKCGCPTVRVGKVATQGGTASVAFDLQSNFFKHVTCLGCGYSELYKVRSDSGGARIIETFLERQT